MLILVVGPSGAGKDSLLAAARAAFRGDPRVHFARRVITRPPDPDGEDHIPASDSAFDAQTFALSWSAHGLRYGIPAGAIAAAPVVVANVSRGAIQAAAAAYQIHVIEVTAPPDMLATRLAARGREDEADVALRLSRSAPIPADVPVETVMNDGTLEEAAARFIAAIRRILVREGGFEPPCPKGGRF